MNEAPKKIWVEYEEGRWPTVLCREYKDAGEPYMRADIVDGLLEALKEMLAYSGIIEERESDYATNKARAALIAMEEE
jgi:hypothetical protein